MRKPIQVGDLLSWIALEDCTILVLDIKQKYDGRISNIYTVLTSEGKIKTYYERTMNLYKVISPSSR
jgi:hypothetical protein